MLDEVELGLRVEVSRSDRFDTERVPAEKVYVADSDAEHYVFTTGG